MKRWRAVLAAAAIGWCVWAVLVLPSARVSARGTHVMALPEFAAGQPVTQVFRMSSDALQAIRVRLAASSPVNLTLEYRLSTARDGVFSERCRARRVITGVQASRWVTLDCRPLEQTRGAPVAVEIRAIGLNGQEGVVLGAVADQPLPNSHLLVNGIERRGGLEFDAIAVDDTAWGRFRVHAWNRLPEWMQAPGVLVGALVMYGVALMVALSLVGRPASAGPDARPPEGGHHTRSGYGTAAGIAICAALVAAMGAVVWVAREENGQVNFIDELHAAELRSTWPLHQGFERLEPELGTERLRAIVALPVSRMSWRVAIPAAARLKMALGVLPPAWNQRGDGVYFKVTAIQDGQSIDLFDRVVDPANVPEDRRWVPVSIDLSRFAGRTIELVMLTEPSAPGRPIEASYDFGAWGAPRIVTASRRP